MTTPLPKDSFRLRLEWKVFQHDNGKMTNDCFYVSVSVWSGRYFNKLLENPLFKKPELFPSPFGVEGISTQSFFSAVERLRAFPSPFGVEGISTHVLFSFPLPLFSFPSPFGVEGISTIPNL